MYHDLSRAITCPHDVRDREPRHPGPRSDRGFPLRSKGSSEVEASSVQRRPSHAMERVD